MVEIQVGHRCLKLLPEKAIYVESDRWLLVSDVHLGKSETFQRFGVPISAQVNSVTLSRLQDLCDQYQPEQVVILGDLFHARAGMTAAVRSQWEAFVETVRSPVLLIVGNHDRALVRLLDGISMQVSDQPVQDENMILSHEPVSRSDRCDTRLNILGHIHPRFHLQTRLDRLKLPCFFLDQANHQLTLPAFGEFTGGYDVTLTDQATAYVIAEDTVIPFRGDRRGNYRKFAKL